MSASPLRSGRPVIRCLRAIAIAGLAGGLAMIPIGLVLRYALDLQVNAYGELVIVRLVGRLDPLLLAIEHAVVSLAMAAPLVVLLNRIGHRAAVAVGLLYGGSAWVIVNSLALPAVFGQPTPWQIGPSAILGSLTVHLVFGLVVALVSRRYAPDL